MDPSRRIRIALFCTTFTLVAVGIVMIYSSSAIYAEEHYGDSTYFLWRHLISVGIGVLLAVGCMLIDYRSMQKYSLWVLGAGLVFLLILLVPHWGASAGGAKRWIGFMGFHIQPSEFAKLAVIFYIADALSRERPPWTQMTVLVGLTCFLILMQPDLGTAAAISAVFMILLYVSGIRGRYFAGFMAAASVIFVICVLLEPYRMRRIISFMRPWDDLQGSGFQLWQSLLAIGSGGWSGVGLGQSQQKLFYLPAHHTDFIFSIIGEETGLAGASFVLLLFGSFVFFGFVVVRKCTLRFGQLASLGLVSLITVEALINIGVSTGSLPTKGLALPFISYGGSSIIVKLMSAGFIMNISRDTKSTLRVQTRV